VGRLHVEIARVGGKLSLEDREGDAGDDSQSESDDDGGWGSDCSESPDVPRNDVVCRVRLSSRFYSEDEFEIFSLQISIREATGLPPAFANFVFCQYTFWGERDAMVVPHLTIRNQLTRTKDGARFRFNYSHVRFFQLKISFRFLKISKNESNFTYLTQSNKAHATVAKRYHSID
jgi:hypothetical protein